MDELRRLEKWGEVDLKPRGRFHGEPVGFELLLKVITD